MGNIGDICDAGSKDRNLTAKELQNGGRYNQADSSIRKPVINVIPLIISIVERVKVRIYEKNKNYCTLRTHS